MSNNIEIIDEMVAQQKKKLLKIARHIEPTVIMDDLWQPNDFPTLEDNPNFRYEEGVLHGLLAVKASFQSQGL